MDKSDKILSAIEHLAQNLTARIDATHADLTARIDATHADLTARIDAVDIRIDATRADLKADIAALSTRIGNLENIAEVAEVKGRVEEQSKMLQIALAGRVSRKPAA